MATFPPKFYCGIYSILLNLASQAGCPICARDLEDEPLEQGGSMPMFGFYVYAEESGARVSAAVA